MKSTRFFLLLILSLFTFNAWAQFEEPEPFGTVSKNATPVDLTVCVGNPVDGILYLYVGNQSLYQGYWGSGYLLMQSIHADFTPQTNVYPGDVIKIYAYLHGVGESGVIYLTVPDKPTATLSVIFNKNSNFKIGASIY